MDMHLKRCLLCKLVGVKQVRSCEIHVSRSTREPGGRDQYLSAPGREVATFGRRGGAGGFKLNYSAKTKKTTKAHDRNEHGDIQHKNTK